MSKMHNAAKIQCRFLKRAIHHPCKCVWTHYSSFVVFTRKNRYDVWMEVQKMHCMVLKKTDGWTWTCLPAGLNMDSSSGQQITQTTLAHIHWWPKLWTNTNILH